MLYLKLLCVLFPGSFGNILFTGYFRPTVEKHIFEVPALKTLIEKKVISSIYLCIENFLKI